MLSPSAHPILTDGAFHQSTGHFAVLNAKHGRTVTACCQADAALEAEGLSPAPQFRRARKANHAQYIRPWVLGCHFPWLNPR